MPMSNKVTLLTLLDIESKKDYTDKADGCQAMMSYPKSSKSYNQKIIYVGRHF